MKVIRKSVTIIVSLMLLLIATTLIQVNVNAASSPLKKKSVSINVGKTFSIKKSGVRGIYWKTSNYDVAYVTSSGKIKADSVGKATISAIVNNKIYKCKVTVKSGETRALKKNGKYTSKKKVAKYIYKYKKLPSNFITKSKANKLGWEGGNLMPYAKNKCIGGDVFSNYEESLPVLEGRIYYECDIDTLGALDRGAKRIVYSNDGLVYYTSNHYQTFIRLY